MERTDWLDKGFDASDARFLMVTAISHHRFRSPIWGEEEIRKLSAELVEIDRAAGTCVHGSAHETSERTFRGSRSWAGDDRHAEGDAAGGEVNVPKCKHRMSGDRRRLESTYHPRDGRSHLAARSRRSEPGRADEMNAASRSRWCRTSSWPRRSSPPGWRRVPPPSLRRPLTRPRTPSTRCFSGYRCAMGAARRTPGTLSATAVHDSCGHSSRRSRRS
jgi:hypothetical protein